jgi:hypothetical protein
MCEHCSKSEVKWERMPAAEESLCVFNDPSEGFEPCLGVAEWVATETLIEGHNCDYHRRYNLGHMGLPTEDFLPIQTQSTDICDGDWAGDQCDQPGSWARLGTIAPFYCTEHAFYMDLPVLYTVELTPGEISPPRN